VGRPGELGAQEIFSVGKGGADIIGTHFSPPIFGARCAVRL
jgi:hypothetical protein